MAINDLFYDTKATLLCSVTGKPDEWGIVQNTYETISEDIPCSLTPISTYHSQQKYGIESKVTFEVSMDYLEDCELATEVVIEETPYKVVSYTVYPKFFCLEKTITYGVKR
ncbi:MAG: hypothetical protein [Malazfec virus 1]